MSTAASSFFSHNVGEGGSGCATDGREEILERFDEDAVVGHVSQNLDVWLVCIGSLVRLQLLDAFRQNVTFGIVEVMRLCDEAAPVGVLAPEGEGVSSIDGSNVDL
jgi:hypothetical protein